MAMIKKSGAKTLVTGCADGYQAFKVYTINSILKGDLEVLHISEFIAKLIKEASSNHERKSIFRSPIMTPAALAGWVSHGCTGKVKRCLVTGLFSTLQRIPPGHEGYLRTTP